MSSNLTTFGNNNHHHIATSGNSILEYKSGVQYDPYYSSNSNRFPAYSPFSSAAVGKSRTRLEYIQFKLADLINPNRNSTFIDNLYAQFESNTNRINLIYYLPVEPAVSTSAGSSAFKQPQAHDSIQLTNELIYNAATAAGNKVTTTQSTLNTHQHQLATSASSSSSHQASRSSRPSTDAQAHMANRILNEFYLTAIKQHSRTSKLVYIKLFYNFILFYNITNPGPISVVPIRENIRKENGLKL
jgi:hypothetical protein